MEDIRYRAALGNIVSEIDRRCHELVHGEWMTKYNKRRE